LKARRQAEDHLSRSLRPEIPRTNSTFAREHLWV